MRPTMVDRSAISLRYYLWADDGPWRIPHQLHTDLVSGKVALPQYAGTKPKIVEVFVRNVRGRPMITEARGGFYSFDARGRLDVSSQVEAAAIAVGGSKARAVQDNVFDIGAVVRHRRWTEEHIWSPSAAMLQEISADLVGRSPALTSRRIRILKPLEKKRR